MRPRAFRVAPSDDDELLSSRLMRALRELIGADHGDDEHDDSVVQVCGRTSQWAEELRR
jgi:hypothetical protein